MYKDKERQKQAVKSAVQKHRKVLQGGITTNGLCNTLTGEICNTQYPAIVYALVDPVKRKKLGKVCYALETQMERQDLRHSVYYGISGLDMRNVSELLEVTR